MQRNSATYVILGFVLLWCAGIFSAPLLSDHSFAPHIYTVYEYVCHQQPAYSFQLNGAPLALCIRCTAIYVGFFVGTIVLPIVNSRILSYTQYRFYIVVLAIPMIVDFLASWTTGYSSTVATRIVSGGLFGIGAALLLVPMFVDAIGQLRQPQPSYSLTKRKGDNI